MVGFCLCKFCSKRFEGVLVTNVKDNNCQVCGGKMGSAKGLAESALKDAAKFEWETFTVSSSFPKSVFVCEEKIADISGPGNYTSLKNATNSFLSSLISSATGKKTASRQADAVFEFDFTNTKSRAYPSNLYVFGHYLKFSRFHCQSRWHCSECGGKGCQSCGGSGKNYPSIEDEVGKAMGKVFMAEKWTLHASGREDVDVRTLGGGRPFVMELFRPCKRNANPISAESESSSNPFARAVGLKKVGKHFLDAVCNSHFNKEYSALVSADRALTLSDAKKLGSLAGMTIRQQTPKRVLSRRTDMERRRKILSISAALEGEGKLRLNITAEAGTYIKELINSDEGRTSPSVSGILSCKASCDELDVIGIHDHFLETISD